MRHVLGGYELDTKMEACALPQRVATGFSKVMHMVGATYTPVLYVGKQIVHGENHMILCLQELAVEDAEKHLVKVVLNATYDGGNVEGNWSIVTIERII